MVLSSVLGRVRTVLETHGIVVSDAWYMDDGQLICQPDEADLVLRTLDVEASKVGVERGRGTSAKTVCRLLGSDAAKNSVSSTWLTEYMMASSVQVCDNDLEGHVLGIDFDDVDGASIQFKEASQNAYNARKLVKLIDDVGCELAVTQSCLGACKVTHLLRASGAFISEEALLVHDNQLQQSLNEMFGCEVPPEALLQISCGTQNGGLGLRRATDLALPAFIASRAESKAAVATLVADLFNDGTGELLMACYGKEMQEAV